jgi:hypothetical protein
MKTATVELEAGGVGCHGQFVDLDWFFVLVVELAKRLCFCLKGGSAPAPGRAGAHRGTLPRCRGAPGRTGAAIVHDSKKKFWWAKKVG